MSRKENSCSALFTYSFVLSNKEDAKSVITQNS